MADAAASMSPAGSQVLALAESIPNAAALASMSPARVCDWGWVPKEGAAAVDVPMERVTVLDWV